MRYRAAEVTSNRKEQALLQKNQTVLSVNPKGRIYSSAARSNDEKKHQLAISSKRITGGDYLSRREITNEIRGRVELENNHGFAETFILDLTASLSRKLRSI